MSLKTPIILLIFRRPDLTAYVFEAIRKVQPTKLLVIADGPRNEEEAVLCQQSRLVTEQVDWECEVLRNYSDSNLGCRNRVASGLDWAFSAVDEGIILEDDCYPHPSFFQFCESLLERYRQDERVGMISGTNIQNGHWRGDGNYFFSQYGNIWGWATWKRAWSNYDVNLSQWPTFRDSKLLYSCLDDVCEVNFWTEVFDKLYYHKEPDTWDHQWRFSCWANSSLAIQPNVNLVTNLGFRGDATHTLPKTHNVFLSNIPTEDIGSIKHPSFLVRDKEADTFIFDNKYGGKYLKSTVPPGLERVKSKAKSVGTKLLKTLGR